MSEFEWWAVCLVLAKLGYRCAAVHARHSAVLKRVENERISMFQNRTSSVSDGKARINDQERRVDVRVRMVGSVSLCWPSSDTAVHPSMRGIRQSCGVFPSEIHRSIRGRVHAARPKMRDMPEWE